MNKVADTIVSFLFSGKKVPKGHDNPSNEKETTGRKTGNAL